MPPRSGPDGDAVYTRVYTTLKEIELAVSIHRPQKSKPFGGKDSEKVGADLKKGLRVHIFSEQN